MSQSRRAKQCVMAVFAHSNGMQTLATYHHPPDHSSQIMKQLTEQLFLTALLQAPVKHCESIEVLQCVAGQGTMSSAA